MPSLPTILIVDDDSKLRETVCAVLTQYDFIAEEAVSGVEAQLKIDTKSIDLMLLDLSLGGEDGLALARKIQKISNIPIIILTARKDPIDKIIGLEIGADDYITKPFNNRELIARINSVLRRSQKSGNVYDNSISSNNRVAKFAGWELDISSQRLIDLTKKEVILTAHEFRLLSVLCQNSKKTLSRERILDLTKGQDWHPTDRSIDVIIAKLRKKLRDAPSSPTFIKTIRGIGYMFIADTEFNRPS